MEIRTYYKILMRRWWLIVVPVLVVAVYTAMTYSPPAPTYQVAMRFSAGTRPAGLSADYDRYYPWLASEYIANGMADVAKTGVFAEAIARRLDDASLAGAIQGAIVTDSAQSVLIVYLTWPDAEQIIDVANAVAAEMTENGATYFPQLSDVEPAVHQLDRPTPATLAPGLRTQLMGPAVKIGLAMAVGGALALLWHYLDPTIREKAELEAVGLSVLAEIPKK
jgi:capsular polysaccharide biosynthesis protein